MTPPISITGISQGQHNVHALSGLPVIMALTPHRHALTLTTRSAQETTTYTVTPHIRVLGRGRGLDRSALRVGDIVLHQDITVQDESKDAVTLEGRVERIHPSRGLVTLGVQTRVAGTGGTSLSETHTVRVLLPTLVGGIALATPLRAGQDVWISGTLNRRLQMLIDLTQILIHLPSPHALK